MKKKHKKSAIKKKKRAMLAKRAENELKLEAIRKRDVPTKYEKLETALDSALHTTL